MSFRKGPSPFCLSVAPCKGQAQRYATANSPPQTVSFRFVKGHSQRCTGVQRAFQPRATLAMSDSETENRFSRTALGFSVSHAAFFRFDCRHCQRPAPAGRVTRARGSLTMCREKTEIQDLETGKSLPRLGKSDHAAEKQHASSVEGRKNMWPPPTNTNQRIIQTSFVYDNLRS